MTKGSLTERESSVLVLVAKGFDNGQIGKELFVSTHTVKAHVGSILKKLNAKNRTNAAFLAAKLGLVS